MTAARQYRGRFGARSNALWLPGLIEMEALGYEPTIDRKEGIALTWKWLQDSAFGAD